MKNASKAFPEILAHYEIPEAKNIQVTIKEPKVDTNEIAECRGAVIKDNQPNKDNLRLAQIENKIHNEALRRINDVTARRQLLKASKEQNISLEEFITSKILGGKDITISDADLLEFLKNKGIAEGDITGDINNDIRERLKMSAAEEKRNLLISDYAKSKLLTKPITIYLQKPQFKLTSAIKNAPTLGPQEAPLEIILFSNLACKDCLVVHQIINQLREDYWNEFRVVFYPTFNVNDPDARLVTEAGQCLLKQNVDLYWKFFDLMTKNPSTEEQYIYDTAKSAGADFDKFKSCFLSRESQNDVNTLLKFSNSVGVQVAPIMVVDGQIVGNAREFQSARALIVSKLQELGADSFTKRAQRFFAKLFR